MIHLLVLIFPIFSLIYMQDDGEVVKNVVAAQRTDGSKILDITYDLESHELYSAYDVKVMVEWDGVDHEFLLTNCRGDVWYNILPGTNKQIECQLTSEVDSENLSGDFYINVLAKATATSELPDSFEFVTIDVDDGSIPTTLIDNDYDLMKYEVTSVQYVEFLNSLLSSAVNVNNNDTDGWSDIEGGETFNRIYQLPNDQWVQVYYANKGGQHITGGYLDNDAKGYGYIYGSYDIFPNQSGFSAPEYGQQLSNTGKWLRLDEISADDNYAKIQFNGGDAGSDNFSFFISEGKGNHPVVYVSFYGADAFADYYGLRIPQAIELLYPLYFEFNLNDEDSASWDYNMFSAYNLFNNFTFSPCESWNFSCDYNMTGGTQECEGVFPNFVNCSTSPVGTYATDDFGGDWYEIYDLLGNATEIAYRVFEDYTFEDYNVLTEYVHIVFGGGFDNTTLFNEENNAHNSINDPQWNFATGFRCVRNIAND